jgi:hypothetical protein
MMKMLVEGTWQDFRMQVAEVEASAGCGAAGIE